MLFRSRALLPALKKAHLPCPLVNHHETVGVAWGVALATSIGIAAASAVAFARAGRPS